MKTIIVASQNPVKINTAKRAFAAMMPNEEFEYIGVAVPSGVSDQPITSEETRQGAIHRAEAARAAHPDSDYFVGLEGGVETVEDIMYTFSWNAIIDNSGKLSTTRSATLALPVAVKERINNGMELGYAMNCKNYKRCLQFLWIKVINE